MFLSAFFALLRLGELTFPDDQFVRDWRKISRRSSVVLSENHYSFTLPAHKADRIFEGSHILVCGEKFSCPSLSHFTRYLTSRDTLFPLASPLWLTAAGTVPTRSFFIRRLRAFFPSDIAGQSLRAGGATMLADLGVSPHIIQAAGRWTSEAFRIYVRKNPFFTSKSYFQSLVRCLSGNVTSCCLLGIGLSSLYDSSSGTGVPYRLHISKLAFPCDCILAWIHPASSCSACVVFGYVVLSISIHRVSSPTFIGMFQSNVSFRLLY